MIISTFFLLLSAGAANHENTNNVVEEGEVVSKIHATNQFEIKAGALARKKGSTPEVRRYGDRLMRDHEMADRLVLKLAKKNSLIVSTIAPSAKASDALQTLTNASGPEFDKAFLAIMDEGHHDAIQALRSARMNLSESAELRGFLDRLIPILGQHHQLALNLERKKG
jgi:putative membrane protein